MQKSGTDLIYYNNTVTINTIQNIRIQNNLTATNLLGMAWACGRRAFRLVTEAKPAYHQQEWWEQR